MNAPTSWDVLSLHLLAIGYRALFHVELFCPSCGDWRGACENVEELNPICPGCKLPAKATALLARGLTRLEISREWKLVSPALPRSVKMAKDLPEGRVPICRPQDDRRRAQGLCTICGESPRDPRSKNWCLGCLKKQREKNHARRLLLYGAQSSPVLPRPRASLQFECANSAVSSGD